MQCLTVLQPVIEESIQKSLFATAKYDCKAARQQTLSLIYGLVQYVGYAQNKSEA